MVALLLSVTGELCVMAALLVSVLGAMAALLVSVLGAMAALLVSVLSVMAALLAPQDTPLRNSRFPSNASLDLSSRFQRSSPSSSPYSPTSPNVPYSPSIRSPYSPMGQQSPFSPPVGRSSHSNGFVFDGGNSSSPVESSGEDLPPAEIAGKSSAGLALVIGDGLLKQEEVRTTPQALRASAPHGSEATLIIYF